jgi:hypothetical protein
MAGCLLTLYVPPSIEETLVDWLLEHASVEGFSSAEAFGHGVRQQGMSLLEQVTGRQRRVQFLIHLEREQADRMLEELRSAFAGVGLHYFLTPVLEAGRL